MEDGRDCEGQQSSEAIAETTSDQREVDMPHQPIVDRIVPFAPVLSQIACIPPIRVEATVCKSCYLAPEIGPGMEETKEDGKPDVSTRYSHTEDGHHDLELVLLLEVDEGLLTLWSHVLNEEVAHQGMGEHEFYKVLQKSLWADLVN